MFLIGIVVAMSDINGSTCERTWVSMLHTAKKIQVVLWIEVVTEVLNVIIIITTAVVMVMLSMMVVEMTTVGLCGLFSLSLSSLPCGV